MEKKIPNNMDKIAEQINKLGLVGVDAVGDDGSVCVRVSGTKERIWDVAKLIESKTYGFNRKGEWIGIGDGVQDGDIWINSYELSEAVNLF